MEETKPITETEKPKEPKKIKVIWSSVISYIDTHGYTSIAVGTGFAVGAFLLVKHLVKRK